MDQAAFRYLETLAGILNMTNVQYQFVCECNEQ